MGRKSGKKSGALKNKGNKPAELYGKKNPGTPALFEKQHNPYAQYDATAVHDDINTVSDTQTIIRCFR
jgi:hypothetical protein